MYRFQKLVYSRQNFWTPYNYRWSGEQALDYDDRGEQNMKKNRTMKVIFNVGALAVLAALGISAYQLGTSQNGEIIQEILPMESVQKSDAKEDEIKEEASAQADTRLVQAETGSGSITAGENLIQEETQTEATAEAAADESNDTTADDAGEETTITVFAAKSLNQVMEELITKFQETHPNVNVQGSYDSSGTLLTQIEEGAACDVFFSAAVKQMDQLDETDGLVVDGTRHNVVNNQVCLVTYKESNTEVTSLEDLNKASSIALADGSVPVGKYTRQALMNLGILDKVDDASTITTEQVSEALGGIEISEQANVSKVLIAVTEGACEVGTTYYSDTYGYEDQIKILQTVSYDLTGNVIYPICRVENKEADDAKKKAADDFLAYVTSDDAKKIFDSYYFDTNVE